MNDPSTVVRITRERHFNGYGRLVPFGWLYRVNDTAVGTRLAEARRWAARHHPGALIIEEWKWED